MGKSSRSNVLWVRPTKPDNFVDGSKFLAQLRRNRNVVEYNYQMLVADSSVLVLNIALGSLFALAFYAIYAHKWDSKWFAVGVSPVTVYFWLLWTRTLAERIAVAKAVALTTFSVMALAPVLRSLTEATSSDTIWAVSTWLCIANVVLATRSLPKTPTADTTLRGQLGDQQKKSAGWYLGQRLGILVLSSNTALATTIVLASRLPTSRSVFYFIMFSIQMYVALPSAARWLWIDYGLKSYAWLVGTVLVATGVLLAVLISPLIAGLWIIVLCSVLWGLPLLFLVLQKHKDQIEGPWDPAKPVLD